MVILDSECLIIKNTAFKELFSNYLKKPPLFITRQCISEYDTDKGNRFNEQALKVVDKNLHNSNLIRKFLWEYQGWFLQKNILDDFFTFVENHHKCSVYEVFKNNRNIFEMVSYWWFIYLNREKYPNYEFLGGENEIYNVFLNDKMFDDYLNCYKSKDHGIIEHLLLGLNNNNASEISLFIKKHCLNFIRFEEWHSGGNVKFLKDFIDHNPLLSVVVL